VIDVPAPAVLDQIAQVASESDEPITANQVAAVLAAYRAVYEGDELGTIRRDPDTGSLAHRISIDGLHKWLVSAPDGSQYYDLQPTLDWPVIQP
jgi:hypothetical protein